MRLFVLAVLLALPVCGQGTSYTVTSTQAGGGGTCLPSPVAKVSTFGWGQGLFVTLDIKKVCVGTNFYHSMLMNPSVHVMATMRALPKPIQVPGANGLLMLDMSTLLVSARSTIAVLPPGLPQLTIFAQPIGLDTTMKIHLGPAIRVDIN